MAKTRLGCLHSERITAYSTLGLVMICNFNTLHWRCPHTVSCASRSRHGCQSCSTKRRSRYSVRFRVQCGGCRNGCETKDNCRGGRPAMVSMSGLACSSKNAATRAGTESAWSRSMAAFGRSGRSCAAPMATSVTCLTGRFLSTMVPTTQITVSNYTGEGSGGSCTL
jgi:hypothetical protein